MNEFYYFEGCIYEKREAAEDVAKDFNYGRNIDVILTEKSFDEFERIYDEMREQGNSCYDSIEWAR